MTTSDSLKHPERFAVCLIFSMKVSLLSNPKIGEEVSQSKPHPILSKLRSDEIMEIEIDINTEEYPLFKFSEDNFSYNTGFNSEDYYLKNRDLNYFERIVF